MRDERSMVLVLVVTVLVTLALLILWGRGPADPPG